MSAQGMPARDGESRRARSRQMVLFAGLATALLLGFAAWMGAGGGKAPAPGAHIEAELAGPGTAEASWTRRSEARLGVIETRLRDMDTQARRLASENERLRAQLKENVNNARDVIDQQKAAIDELQRGQASPTPQAQIPDGELFAPGGAVRQPAPGAANAPAAAPLIESFALDGPAPGSPGAWATIPAPWMRNRSRRGCRRAVMPRRWCSRASTPRPASPARATRARCCCA